jgi:hypothetical protein
MTTNFGYNGNETKRNENERMKTNDCTTIFIYLLGALLFREIKDDKNCSTLKIKNII